MIKIIFAEKGKEISKIYEELLNDRNFFEFNIIGIEKGINVPDLIEKENPDVVILGTELDDCDSFDLLEKLRRTYPHLPIVLNVDCDQDLADPRSEAATLCCKKSCYIDRLENAIMAAIRK